MKHDWKHVRDAEGKYVPGERQDSQGNSCSRKGGLMVRVNLRFTVLYDFPFCAFKKHAPNLIRTIQKVGTNHKGLKS